MCLCRCIIKGGVGSPRLSRGQRWHDILIIHNSIYVPDILVVVRGCSGIEDARRAASHHLHLGLHHTPPRRSTLQGKLHDCVHSARSLQLPSKIVSRLMARGRARAHIGEGGLGPWAAQCRQRRPQAEAGAQYPASSQSALGQTERGIAGRRSPARGTWCVRTGTGPHRQKGLPPGDGFCRNAAHGRPRFHDVVLGLRGASHRIEGSQKTLMRLHNRKSSHDGFRLLVHFSHMLSSAPSVFHNTASWTRHTLRSGVNCSSVVPCTPHTLLHLIHCPESRALARSLSLWTTCRG